MLASLEYNPELNPVESPEINVGFELIAVLINHGEYFTVYSGLKTVSVKLGDEVLTKEKIATFDKYITAPCSR